MANWTVCHFCKRFGVCEAFENRWRCRRCAILSSASSRAWHEAQSGTMSGNRNLDG